MADFSLARNYCGGILNHRGCKKSFEIISKELAGRLRSVKQGSIALNPLLIYIPQFNLRKIGLRCCRSTAFFQGKSSIPQSLETI
jgi:hypothetical protein